jgi:hypothetical protein
LARLIVVSNRVAVPTRDGNNHAGGLAVAVRSLLKRHGGLWFGWSGTIASEGDVTIRTIRQGGLTYVVTDLAEADYQEYYNGFANRVLWPILHYRLDLALFSRRDLSGAACLTRTTSCGCTTIISFRWPRCCASAAIATRSGFSCMYHFLRPRF